MSEHVNPILNWKGQYIFFFKKVLYTETANLTNIGHLFIIT